MGKHNMTDEYLVDSIFPSQEVHLIAGPSGAGKTTFLLQFIDAWRNGKPFVDHPSHPLPFVYVSADRSERSVRRTFHRLHIEWDTFPVESLLKIKSRNLPFLLSEFLRQRPDTRVFFVEGFQTFVPNGKVNDYVIVSQFLTTLVRFCIQEGVTIFGVAHAAKTKQDEAYENPRQKIAGSVAWAAYTDTIIFIEPSDATVPDSPRNVMVLPRNAPEHTYQMIFRDGRLMEKPKPLTGKEKLRKYLLAVPTSTELTTEEILLRTGIPRSTLTIALDDVVSGGLLVKLRQGVYLRHDNTNLAKLSLTPQQLPT